MPTTRYPELEEMQAELDNVALLYNLYQEVEAAMTQWHNTLWHEMNLPAVADVVQGFQVIPAVSSMPESPMPNAGWSFDSGAAWICALEVVRFQFSSHSIRN